jgi:hypothetical protein
MILSFIEQHGSSLAEHGLRAARQDGVPDGSPIGYLFGLSCKPSSTLRFSIARQPSIPGDYMGTLVA